MKPPKTTLNTKPPEPMLYTGKNIIEDFMLYARELRGTPYKLGSKDPTNGYLDCSGLLSSFLVQKGLIDKQQKLYSSNSFQLYNRGEKKDVKTIQRGDAVFFLNVTKGSNVHHIGFATESIVVSGNAASFTMIDASFEHGVSKRTVQINYDGKDWIWYDRETKFKVRASKIFNQIDADEKVCDKKVVANPINIEKYRDRHQFRVTNYTPGNGDPINCGGASCAHTASGLPLKDEYAGIVGACPRQFPFGTKFEIKGFGIIECKDRGGLIVMKGDKNSRCNTATMNRLDIFAGMGKNIVNAPGSQDMMVRLID